MTWVGRIYQSPLNKEWLTVTWLFCYSNQSVKAYKPGNFPSKTDQADLRWYTTFVEQCIKLTSLRQKNILIQDTEPNKQSISTLGKSTVKRWVTNSSLNGWVVVSKPSPWLNFTGASHLFFKVVLALVAFPLDPPDLNLTQHLLEYLKRGKVKRTGT